MCKEAAEKIIARAQVWQIGVRKSTHFGSLCACVGVQQGTDAWKRVATISDKFGARFSGSESLEKVRPSFLHVALTPLLAFCRVGTYCLSSVLPLFLIFLLPSFLALPYFLSLLSSGNRLHCCTNASRRTTKCAQGACHGAPLGQRERKRTFGATFQVRSC